MQPPLTFFCRSLVWVLVHEVRYIVSVEPRDLTKYIDTAMDWHLVSLTSAISGASRIVLDLCAHPGFPILGPTRGIPLVPDGRKECAQLCEAPTLLVLASGTRTVPKRRHSRAV